MSSRSELHITRVKGKPWLTRKWFPKPRSDMLAVEDHLVELSEDEVEFKHGRFRTFSSRELEHTVQVWLDHEDEDKRAFDLREMLFWIWHARVGWNFLFNSTERIGIMFSFDDPITAFMFMTYYGGSAD